jgi:glycosyltransferase involved in cell wall biosynthesis
VNTTPEVSVIIPYYNGERFVADAIRSVLGQSRRGAEVVVVDDGSSPAAEDPFAPFAQDTRVRVLRHETNRGIAAARNTGIHEARGAFIGFLDQDDRWRMDKLSLQVERFLDDRSGEIGLIFSAVEAIDEGTGLRTREPQKVPPDIDKLDTDALLARLITHHVVTLGSALVRAECIRRAGLFDETIRGGSDDFDYIIRLAQCCRFTYVNEPLLVRRLHGENYTRAQKMVPDSLKVLERLVSKRPQLKRAARQARSRFLYLRARELHAGRERSRAMAVYRDAIAAYPLNLKPLAAALLCATGPLGDGILTRISRINQGRRKV